MKHLKPEEWDLLFEVLQGIREGKTIQWHRDPMSADAHEWLDDTPLITDVVQVPLRYRVKPETVTVHVYRTGEGSLEASSHAFVGWPPLYSFEHEVQA